MADVKYGVQVEAGKAIGDIDKLDRAWEKLDAQHKETARSAATLGSGMTSIWKQMAIGSVVAQGVTRLFSSITREILSVSKAAQEQESADVALASALELTGRSIPLDEMKAFASQMQNMTKYGDEAVQASQTLLVQMTKLDKEGIERATRGAIGLASTMRMDLFAATSLVQKALGGQIGALSRYGISVDQTATKEEQQIELMGKLEVLFGRAQAEVNTYAGRMAQLKNAYGDMKESIGAAIVNNEKFKELIKGITEKIQTLIASGKLDEWADKISAAINVAISTLESFFTMIDDLSKGKSLGQSLADKIFGVKGDIAEKTAAAIAEMNRFAKSLTSLKPQFNDMKVNMEAGAENWAAYTKRVKELDAQLTKERALPPYLTETPKVLALLTKKTVDASLGINLFTQNLEDLERQFIRLDETIDWDKIFPKGDDAELPDFIQKFIDGGAALSDAATAQAQALIQTYDQVQASVVDGFTSIMDGTKSMGEYFNTVVTSMIAGMGKLVIAEILFAKTSVKGSMMQSIARHIANIFKSVPFPLDIVLAAGAFGVVSKLFSSLLKFKEGGVVSKPTIAEIGHGTEYVLPEQKLINLVRDAMRIPLYGQAAPAMAGAGGPRVSAYFNGPIVQTTGISDADLRRAGAKMKRELDRQLLRIGR